MKYYLITCRDKNDETHEIKLTFKADNKEEALQLAENRLKGTDIIIESIELKEQNGW